MSIAYLADGFSASSFPWLSLIAGAGSVVASIAAMFGATRARQIETESRVDEARELVLQVSERAEEARGRLRRFDEHWFDELEDSPEIDSQHFAATIEARTASVADRQAEVYMRHLKGTLAYAERTRLVATVAVVLGLIALITGFGVALFAAVDVGVFTAACGALTTGIGALAFKSLSSAEANANESFGKLNDVVSVAEQVRASVELAMRVTDPRRRDELLTAISLSVVFRNAPAAELIPRDLVRQTLHLPEQEEPGE